MTVPNFSSVTRPLNLNTVNKGQTKLIGFLKTLHDFLIKREVV